MCFSVTVLSTLQEMLDTCTICGLKSLFKPSTFAYINGTFVEEYGLVVCTYP